MKIINLYSFICYSAVLLWIFNPLFIRGYPLKKRDGSLVIYRNSVLNTLLSFIPISIYERIYPIVYLIEAIEISHITYDIVFYYTIVIQFCWMLTAQLKIIAFKCESCGYENEEIGNRNDRNYVIYLKQLLSDYTKLHVSIRKFYEIMKSMTLFTYGYYFNLYITFTYMCILNYFKNDYVLSVTFAKLLLTASVVCIDLLIMCYFYGYLENQINDVQFAMYSIDWTEKSIEFKKNLLLAMSLNNANRLKMNITPQKSLNLEVFASAVRVSYSIISLLVKKTISK
ncbi:uncharacterized protein LOC126907350 [Daktulosphaira vitifoliae]|uniref:uncharacterized protein LOC126907350 n=1 Tax=Daktulosphaira vitifoliae TaxID=58002 RepID=UPI0021AAB288|nr:uncharacterized protein LOC126907350 [Daktulosphaira vitifoliae]